MNTIQTLIQKSNGGDAEASWELAQCYDYGRGCRISKSKARDYYLRSYELGKGDAAFHFEWLRDHPEYVKMIDGEYYNPGDEEITRRQHKCRECIDRFNTSHDMPILHDLLPGLRERANVRIDAPFLCDFGDNIYIGANSYVGMNCLMLDSAPIYIGERVVIDAGVQIYTASHPLNAEERSKGLVIAKSVVIEDDVYIGPGAIICPGVTLGKGAVVAAGAVVTHDVQPGYRAQGNPATCTRIAPEEIDLFDELG